MLGIFDSGSGGLTVLREIKKLAPELDIIYFADFKNIPYGEKTKEELALLTTVAIERLIEEGALNIVSACNSVSASLAQPIFDILGEGDVEIVEMVEPAVQALLPRALKGSRILLMATEATVQSGIYAESFASHGIDICSVSAPTLVPAIEGGESKEAISSLIQKTLEGVDAFDILILGCTQYPLVRDLFEEVLVKKHKDVSVFNPAEAVAKEVVRKFGNRGNGSIRFLLSAPAPLFELRVQSEWGKGDALTITHL